MKKNFFKNKLVLGSYFFEGEILNIKNRNIEIGKS
jgi:hypothetical protein